MTTAPSSDDALQAYIQADAPGRAELFTSFLQSLKERRPSEPEEAAVWARRAVSPLLDYSSLLSLRRFLGAPASGENTLRLAILGGPTTIQLGHLIEVFLAGEGIAAEIYEGGFGLFRQEILLPGSGLDLFRPHLIFIATSFREAGHLPPLDAGRARVEELAERDLAAWAELWAACQARWNATVIQNNFDLPAASAFGHHSLRHPAAKENYLERLNRLLAETAPAHVILHDLRGLVGEMGSRNWCDARLYFEFKMPCGPEQLVTYAYSVFSLIRAVRGRSKKVFVLDLDNTLWGGEVGEVGVGGIRLGQGSGEGEAYIAFQQYLKEVLNRGVLLAVCSKNDPEKAREPFQRRTDMILKLTDISCFVANWENKADNLKVISQRLALGLNSFVFLDDRPGERALVRRFCPEVAVPDLPEDPSGYVQAVSLHRYVEMVSFTVEDLQRSGYYAQNQARQEALSSASDVDSFLASLNMTMLVEPVSHLNSERVTQLINKSNQFNLTTRRYTKPEIDEIAASREWLTRTFSLRDNLGDNGLISIVLLRQDGPALVIDTWVMSCRVLQRGVEQFVRNELVSLALEQGSCEIRGRYIPTAKNEMVRGLFSDLGFTRTECSEDAETDWSLSVDKDLEPLHHHIN